MIKRVLAGALGVTLGLMAVTAAHAAPPEEMPAGSLEELVQSIADAGFTIRGQAGPTCANGLIMGYVNTRERTYNLCVDNIETYAQTHGLDANELFDKTAKHEAFHVAQYCKGGPIAPALVEFNIDLAQGVTDWHILGYDSAVWPLEAEAHLAQHLEISTVTNYINAYCN